MHSGSDLRLAELERRVLGKFQLLHALIGIRLRTVTDPESRRHLAWLNDMVAALEMLNRRLTSGGLEHFGAYLEEVAAFWSRVGGERSLEFELDLQPVRLDDTVATCIAIIVHELLTAAVAEGSDDPRPRRVGLSLSRDGTGVVLVVSGLLAKPSEARQTDAGVELVEGLAEHIGGSVERDAGAGRLTVRFPQVAAAARPH